MHRVLVKPKGRASIAVSDDRQAFVNGASGCRLGGSFLHATCRATRRSAACARRIYTGSRRSRRGCKGRARIIERWQRSEGIVSGRSGSAWQGPNPWSVNTPPIGLVWGWAVLAGGLGGSIRLVLPPAVPRAASAPLEASSGVAATKNRDCGIHWTYSFWPLNRGVVVRVPGVCCDQEPVVLRLASTRNAKDRRRVRKTGCNVPGVPRRLRKGFA